MQISVKNAYANNLKNISVDIPLGRITAITGVSGSGKSTLLKDILGAYGAKNLTRISSKTVQDALLICDNPAVDRIDNLPITILIDVKSSVSNPMSTVSTVSGIHESLRNLLVKCGATYCDNCGERISRDFTLIQNLSVDLRIDNLFNSVLDYIHEHGDIKSIDYFDKNGEATTTEKKKALATVYFSLEGITERLIHEFNKRFHCSVAVISETAGIAYNFEKEIECANCHHVGPRLTRSRISFNTPYSEGGGACRCCSGRGMVSEIDSKLLFKDENKGIFDGASDFITKKGIKYTVVTEKFITAFYKEMGVDITMPISELPNDMKDRLIYGVDKKITFMDRIGGKKTLAFEGIANYLRESFQASKGGDALSALFDQIVCPECCGRLFDDSIQRFKYSGKSMYDFMGLTLNDLNEWSWSEAEKASGKARKYLDKISKSTDCFKLLSCGHLQLSRLSNTLSGGELQRIRVSKLLNANVHGLCYLLDEPSSGLHYSDIENLIVLLRRICNNGNTVVMVEHNKKLLSCCDYIVDMGPYGGNKGGNILFSASINELAHYNTATSRAMLSNAQADQAVSSGTDISTEYLEFRDLCHNNLKNVTVRFPINAYTAICGISGSGKTTFVRKAVLPTIDGDPAKFGFSGVNYLGQTPKAASNQSTVGSRIKITDYVAKKFEIASNGKLKKQCFIIGTSDGKCPCCEGKGRLYSSAGELLGVCDQCNGLGFDEETLQVKVDGLNIYDFYNTHIEDLEDIFNDKRIQNIILFAKRLGIGYLSFSRQARTLSKGELQRVSLIQILAEKKKNQLLILDEPSKGLHASDTINLVAALHDIIKLKNTVLVVEHNPEMIRSADYVIEFGGTGTNGGYLLHQGSPKNMKDTPTAKMLESVVLSESASVSDARRDITIETDDGTILTYTPCQVYYDSEHADILLRAAKRSQEDYLSVAIPNNSMFTRLDSNTVESDTPFMMIIDFKEKIKYSILVLDALDIRHFLVEKAKAESGENLAEYIFNPSSKTGKCQTCGGKGKVMSVSESFFLKDGELTASCKKFLKNSTDYAQISKLLKRDKLNFAKSISGMSADERGAIFWGTDKTYEINKKPKRWEGIVPLFMQYHSYYDDSDAVNTFKKRTEVVCPVCGGMRLKAKYRSYSCCNLSYEEWMSCTIDDLLDKISTVRKDRNVENIISRLLLVQQLGLGSLCLSDELSSLDAAVSERIKLASLVLNKIYGIGIIIKNAAALPLPEQETVQDAVHDLSHVNTIWIV